MKTRMILSSLAAVAITAGTASAGTVYQLDMERTLTESDGGTSAITESGWTSSAADNGGASATLPTPAGVTITAGGTGGFFQGRGGGTWGTVNVTDAAWDDMVGDTTAARGGDGTVVIAFTGLSADVHTLTAWHNVSATDGPSFSNGLYAITPSITTGSLVSATSGAASNIAKDDVGVVASDFNNSVISFTADGSGNATIVLTSASANQFLTLSGVELTNVPEPGSLALLGLGGLALLRRRRA